MASRRLLWTAVTLSFAIAIAVAEDQQQDCSDVTYSKFLGAKQTGAKYIDHMRLRKQGAITHVSLYYDKAAGCLRGVKAVFGPKSTPGQIGASANTTDKEIKLNEGEFVNKVDYKAAKCVQYVKLHTNKGRSVSAGSANASAALVTTAPNKSGGRLIAIRGFQGMHDSKPTALQQLQFIWGSGNCHPATAGAAAELNYESGSAINTDPTVCAPKLDMCNEKASMNQFSYCVWNQPFKKSACRGGCCFSSGKCASSSCTISGVGKDVANMICYGTNQGIGFGGSELCSGLACKLATTGCTTDAFGGNCVGTVVHYAKHVEVHSDSKKYIGATCLDATPSEYTLNENGEDAGNEGVYMSKLWTICDCATDGSDPFAGVPNVMNLTGMSNITKNDVLLAISQVLPTVNLSDVLGGDKEHGVTELFPSFTDIFKKPTGMASVTLPSIFNTDKTAEGVKDSNKSETIQFKLPDLSTLLKGLASKSNSTDSTDKVAAAAEPSLMPPITPATVAAIPAKIAATAAKPAAAMLTGLKGLLGKMMPSLTRSNMRTAGPANATAAAAAPVAVAAVPAAGNASVSAATKPPSAGNATVPLPAAIAPVAVAAVPVAAPQPSPAAQQAVSIPTNQPLSQQTPQQTPQQQTPQHPPAAAAPLPASPAAAAAQPAAVAGLPAAASQSSPSPIPAATNASQHTVTKRPAVQYPAALVVHPAATAASGPDSQKPAKQKSGFSGLQAAIAGEKLQSAAQQPAAGPAAQTNPQDQPTPSAAPLPASPTATPQPAAAAAAATKRHFITGHTATQSPSSVIVNPSIAAIVPVSQGSQQPAQQVSHSMFSGLNTAVGRYQAQSAGNPSGAEGQSVPESTAAGPGAGSRPASLSEWLQQSTEGSQKVPALDRSNMRTSEPANAAAAAAAAPAAGDASTATAAPKPPGEANAALASAVAPGVAVQQPVAGPAAQPAPQQQPAPAAAQAAAPQAAAPAATRHFITGRPAVQSPSSMIIHPSDTAAAAADSTSQGFQQPARQGSRSMFSGLSTAVGRYMPQSDPNDLINQGQSATSVQSTGGKVTTIGSGAPAAARPTSLAQWAQG